VNAGFLCFRPTPSRRLGASVARGALVRPSSALGDGREGVKKHFRVWKERGPAKKAAGTTVRASRASSQSKHGSTRGRGVPGRTCSPPRFPRTGPCGRTIRIAWSVFRESNLGPGFRRAEPRWFFAGPVVGLPPHIVGPRFTNNGGPRSGSHQRYGVRTAARHSRDGIFGVGS